MIDRPAGAVAERRGRGHLFGRVRLSGEVHRSSGDRGADADRADHRGLQSSRRALECGADVCHPGETAGEGVQAADGDGQEGPHHVGIELRARTAHQLLSTLVGAGGRLVRSGGGDHVVGVGHRHDPPGQADLGAGQARGVAGAVPAFMVLAGGQPPVTQPALQRLHQLGADLGVELDGLPLGVVETVGLGEDGSGYGQLADVVTQGSPVQELAIGRRQVQLLADEVGVGPHPLGVAAGQALVLAQCVDEHQQLRGRLGRVAAETLEAEVLHLLFELAHRSRAQSDSEARRCVVGEHQRHAEQVGERHEAAGDPLGDDGDGEAERAELKQEERQAHMAGRPIQVGTGDPRHHQRHDSRRHDDGHPQGARHHGSGRPGAVDRRLLCAPCRARGHGARIGTT